MNMTKTIVSVILGGALLSGCMSLEERLASNDPNVRQSAELELISNSRKTGTEADRIDAIKRVTTVDLLVEIAKTAKPAQHTNNRIVPSTIPDGLAALEKISDQGMLSRLACMATSKDIRMKAGEKVTDNNLLLPLYRGAPDAEVRNDMLGKMPATMFNDIKYNAELIPFWRKVSDQRTLALIYRDGNMKLAEDERNALVAKITDDAILAEMVSEPDAEKVNREQAEKNRRRAELRDQFEDAKRKSEEWFKYAKQSKGNFHFRDAQRQEAKAKEYKLLAVKLKKELGVLETEGSSSLYVENENAREILYAKIKQENLVAMTKERVTAQTFADWNAKRVENLTAAANMIQYIADEKAMGEAVVSVLRKINDIRAKCHSGWGYRWTGEDQQIADGIVKVACKKLNDNMIENIVERDRSSWSVLSELFKDKNRASRLAVKYINEARTTKDDNKIKRAFNEYADAIVDDNALIKFSVDELIIRRPAFDKIKDVKARDAALEAIRQRLKKDLQAAGEKQGQLSTFIAEIGNGEDLVAWLKGKQQQTELQNRETFAKMKGKTIILRGSVRDVGKTMFSGTTYVSLRVDKVGAFGHIDIQFNVPKTLQSEVMTWMKDETHIMRGRISGEGDISDDATCDDGEIVAEERYKEVVGLKGEMDCIKWQLKQLEENHAPAESVSPSKFGTAVKSAAEWIKSGVDDIKSSGDDLKKAAELINGLLN